MKKIHRRLTVLFLATLALLMSGCRRAEVEPEPSAGNGSFRVEYAEEGITVVDDPEALQKAVDEAYARSQETGMTLSYRNDAYSNDGVNVSCYIANHPNNEYDMFVAIFADIDFTDELYLSKLLRPGTAFNEIALERKLEPGDHEVYVVYTQIEETDGEQSIRDQHVVSMIFHVNGS